MKIVCVEVELHQKACDAQNSQMSFYIEKKILKMKGEKLEFRFFSNKISDTENDRKTSFTFTGKFNVSRYEKTIGAHPYITYSNEPSPSARSLLTRNFCTKNIVLRCSYALTHTSTTQRFESIVLYACEAAALATAIRLYVFVCFDFSLVSFNINVCVSNRTSRQRNIASHIQSSNIWIAYSSTSHCLESDFFTIF